MSNDKRDLLEFNPEDFLIYTSPNTSPKTEFMVEKKVLDFIGRMTPPQEDKYVGGGSYYTKSGRYAGSASANHFLGAPEVVNYMLTKEEFVRASIDTSATWWIPEHIRSLFLF